MRIALGSYSGGLVGWATPDAAGGGDGAGKSARGAAATGTLALKLQYAFNAHIGAVRCAAIDTSDGNILVTSGEDESVRVYDLSRKRELGCLEQHKGEATALAFVGKTHLLSGGSDGIVCIWRTRDWQCLHTMKGHRGAVKSIAVHPSGRIALTTGEDANLRLWDLVKGKCAHTRRAVPRDISERLEATGADATGALSLRGSAAASKVAQKVAFSPSGDRFAVAAGARLLVHETAVDGSVATTINETRVNDMVWITDDTLAVGGEDAGLHIYRWAPPASGAAAVLEEVATIETAHKYRVRSMALSEDGPLQLLLTADSVGTVQIWDALALSLMAAGEMDASDMKALGQLRAGETDTRVTCMAASRTHAGSDADGGAGSDGDSDGDSDGVGAGGSDSDGDGDGGGGGAKGGRKGAAAGRGRPRGGAGDGAAVAAGSSDARRKGKSKKAHKRGRNASASPTRRGDAGVAAGGGSGGGGGGGGGGGKRGKGGKKGKQGRGKH